MHVIFLSLCTSAVVVIGSCSAWSVKLLSVCNTSISDMQDALVAIKGGGVPPPSSLPSFQEIKDTLGFNRYYEEDKQYSIPQAQPSLPSGEP